MVQPIKHTALKLPLVAAAVLLASAAGAQLRNAGDIDRWLENRLDGTHIPGAVAMVVDRDSTLYEGAFGTRNAAGDEASTLDTIYRIASMTKPVATTVIMMLADEGALDLDDPVSDYLPDFSNRGVVESVDANGRYTTRPVAAAPTIRQMLSHSSGLAYTFASDEIAAISASADAPAADAMPLLYDPGESWSYSGGIAVVGGIVERITGLGLDALMRQRLFEPLGMNDTSFIVPAAKHDRVATIFRLDESGRLIESPNPVDIRSGVSGDGGLHSTARDYARFIQLFLNDGVGPDGNRLLSRRALRELTRNQLGDKTVTLQDEPTPLLARAFPLGAGRDGFGLGFQVTGQHADEFARAPGSLSWAGIFNTEFWIDPASGIGGILLMQYLPFYDAEAIDTLVEFEEYVYRGL